MSARPPAETKHLRLADSRLRWDLLPGGTTPGTRRGVYEGIAATTAMVNVLVIEPEQVSPRHTFDAEHVVYQVRGTVEWVVGDGTYLLEPGDLLYIPAHEEYGYRNPGAHDGVFVDVAGKVDRWPPTMSYHDGAEVRSGDLDLFKQ